MSRKDAKTVYNIEQAHNGGAARRRPARTRELQLEKRRVGAGGFSRHSTYGATTEIAIRAVSKDDYQ